MRKLWYLWCGGSNYAVGGFEDIETASSIESVKRIHDSRDDGWEGGVEFPCVDDQAETWVFLSEPVEGDLYPDRIIRRGPRGGIRVERC